MLEILLEKKDIKKEKKINYLCVENLQIKDDKIFNGKLEFNGKGSLESKN